MKKLLIVLIASLVLLTACTGGVEKDPWQVNMVSSIGAENNNPDSQKYSYEISVAYTGNQNIEILDVQPVISDTAAEAVRITGQPRSIVEKTATAMTVKGSKTLATGSMSKQEILALGPVIRPCKSAGGKTARFTK